MCADAAVVKHAGISGPRSAGMAIVAIAIAALAGLALSPAHSEPMESHSAEYADAMVAPPAHTLFDIESIKSRVQATVVSTVSQYASQGTDIFDAITPDTRQTGIIYAFVLDAETLEVVANSAFPNPDGVLYDAITSADRPVDEILADLRSNGATWTEYMATNPDTSTVQLKHSWLYLHDGYIFGAGYYASETRVQGVVDDAVNLFKEMGVGAFGVITPDDLVITAAFYPFVLNATDWSTVAHATIPSLVGVCCSDAIRNTGDRPIEVIIEDLNREGGTWVEYVFTNPDTQTEQLKRTWLYQHGDYIFGSGYYIQDSRVQSLVEEAIHLYSSHGTGAFDIITPGPEDESHTLIYYFVLDEDTLEIKAHSGLPHVVGTVDSYLDAADISLNQIRDKLSREEGIWVAYISENPNTRTDQMTRTYLVEYDGHIFGSGYYYPDSRLQSNIDKAIYTYKSAGTDAFDIIATEYYTDGLTTLVRNQTHIFARALGPGIPTPPGPVTLAESGLSIQAARSLESNYFASKELGFTTASVFSISSITRSEQVLQVYGEYYDGFVFSGSYIVADADAQSVVDYALRIYQSNIEDGAWMDIITPDRHKITDDIYPFVLNATDWSTVAHGTIPEQVGECCSDAIRFTSIQPFEMVLEELESDGTVWVEYEFLNPDTGTDQLKRTWLVQKDGYIFGAGYYISDSRAQALVFSTALNYGFIGRGGVLGMINNVPDEPNSLYTFVVDPATGATIAQGADPSIIGSTTDWEAAIAADPGLLDTLQNENGDFVSYMFMNPKTGEVENKRSWLAIHQGDIIGVGYYDSDAVAYQNLLRSLSDN